MNKIGVINAIVKPMERGQITIPVNIRKELKITPQTWLWIRLIKKDKILIEPVERKSSSSFLNYLKGVVSDPRVYWTKEDSVALSKIRKKSLQRLRKLT